MEGGEGEGSGARVPHVKYPPLSAPYGGEFR
jgi:hypothetical protein